MGDFLQSLRRGLFSFPHFLSRFLFSRFGGYSFFVIFLIFSIPLVASCTTPARTRENILNGKVQLDSGIFDTVTDDVLQLIDDHRINASGIRFRGVGLRDPVERVVEVFGKPTKMDIHPGGIINLRYDSTLNETMVTFHLVNNTVQRIVFKEGMDQFLVNSSKVSLRLSEITSRFGKPDYQEDTKYYRLYKYYPEGLELYHRRKQLLGWGIVEPEEIPQQETKRAFTRVPLEEWGRNTNVTSENESVEPSESQHDGDVVDGPVVNGYVVNKTG